MTDCKPIIITSLLTILTATGCVPDTSADASGKTKPEAQPSEAVGKPTCSPDEAQRNPGLPPGFRCASSGLHGGFINRFSASQAPPDKPAPPKKGFYRNVAQRLHAAAGEWQGTRHCLGGSSKQCTDCSGLVQRLYADLFAVALPRRSADQGRAGRQVAREALQPGDVLYFNPPSHSGIYLGENEFLHTSTRKGVMISRLDTDPYWNKRFVGARRVLDPE